jgi:hypothetical protein
MSRLLLDECIDARLKDALAAHDVSTVNGMRWAGIADARLLQRSQEAGFDAIVTTDRGLPHQRPAGAASLIIVLLRAQRNRLADLLPLVPEVLQALDRAAPGETVEVSAP